MGGLTFAAAALASIKDTYELASAALGVKEGVKRDLALAELLPKILAAQQVANKAVQEEATLFEEIRALKEENRQLKAQRGELEQYERRRFFPGSVAYVPKSTLPDDANPHYACAHCYEDRQKVLSLQPTGELGRRRNPIHRCASCGLEVELGEQMGSDEPTPQPEPPRKINYDNRGIV